MKTCHKPRAYSFLIGLCVLPGVALAGDIAGSKDHPIVSRYAGSEILMYQAKTFDRYVLPLAKVDDARRGADKSETLEGRITRINYRAPSERSALEVFRNYEQSLRGAGFEILFECQDQACGNELSGAVTINSIMRHHNRDQKYLAAKLSRPDGNVYIALYTIGAYGVGGPNQDRVFTQLDVIEPRAMQTAQVKVDAAAMAGEIAKHGRIALYGIHFDSGKADIKPESKSALDEIGKLLQRDPALKLLVIGHTDSAGEFDYNIELSRRRAQAVVQALVSHYGVAAARLKPWGAGYTSPTATNRSDDGRARNRRVELVAP